MPGRAMPSPEQDRSASRLVLASASAVRTRLLTAAGVPHIVDPAHVDEGAVRDAMLGEKASHPAIAEALAELKAQRISQKRKGEIVLGSDQVLSCDGVLFEKPPGIGHVRAHLEALMGKAHSLHTSACVVRDGAVLWYVTTESVLHMRTLSEGFIDRYVDRVGDDVCQSVGAYQLEGLGSQLFSRIDGNFFDILGLPLLPLLEFLRNNDMLET